MWISCVVYHPLHSQHAVVAPVPPLSLPLPSPLPPYTREEARTTTAPPSLPPSLPPCLFTEVPRSPGLDCTTASVKRHKSTFGGKSEFHTWSWERSPDPSWSSEGIWRITQMYHRRNNRVLSLYWTRCSGWHLFLTAFPLLQHCCCCCCHPACCCCKSLRLGPTVCAAAQCSAVCRRLFHRPKARLRKRAKTTGQQGA